MSPNRLLNKTPRRLTISLGLIVLLTIILIGVHNIQQTFSGSLSRNVYSYFSDLPITSVPNGKICWDADQVASVTPVNVAQSLKDLGDSAAASNPGDTGLAIQLDNLTNATRIGYSTYLVSSNSHSTAQFEAYNPALINGQTLHLRAMVLLDDHQVSFMPDPDAATQLKPYLDFILAPQRFQTTKISIPDLTIGVHELIMLWIREPQTNTDYNIAATAGAGSSMRVTLIVGQVADSVERPVSPLPILHDSKAPFLNLTLDQPFQTWVLPSHSATISDNSPLAFFVEAKHQGASSAQHPSSPNQPEKVALILFVDGIQTAWPDNQLATYVKLVNDDDYVRIPAKVTFPPHSGQHEIAVLRIDYPGVPMCFMWGNPNGIIFPQQTKTSLADVTVQ